MLISVFACASLRAAVPQGEEAPPPHSQLVREVNASQPDAGVLIQEYRVRGSKVLPPREVEAAVYPYLGPGRTEADVEAARAALEKAYQDKGYQTVAVEIPEQRLRGGVVYLEVIEAPVGRLRVRGSRYYDINHIKKGAPSLAEGKVPNFNEVAKDIVRLNQLRDRRITPSIQPGVVPGTVDVDLTVKDSIPLHGSVELNNRYSVNTTPLRLNGAISYENLWQLAHTIGFNFQIAPQRIDDAVVYGGYYIARAPAIDWLGLMVSATRQNSNVSTLGGAAVAGNGEIVGFRFLINLPSGEGFFHSMSAGLDYKHLEQDLMIGDEFVGTPITYWPFTVAYNGAWVGKNYTTELGGSIVFHARGMGSDEVEFDNRRYNADGGFIYFRGDLSHTHELPLGFEIFGRVQGQVSSDPLVDAEQFAGGGLDTARGYLESEVLGDNALFGTVELISPALAGVLGINEWRIFGFLDAGFVTLEDPLPEQQSRFDLASIGAGSRLQLFNHLNGSVDIGVPMVSQSSSPAGQPRVTFRAWLDF